MSKAKKRLKHLTIPVSDYQNLSIAASKKQTIQKAKKLNVPTPNTTIINSLLDLENHDFKFPLVVKGVYGSGLVTYVHNMQSLKDSVATLRELQGEYPLIQEYIPGQGYGFFALFNEGELRATFMHKRIREYPATGGMSTCAESVYEPKLQDYGLRLLKALHWHGVAMVEFKKDVRDKEFKLMEINPRFWGSLDLPVAAGVDFPYLLYKMAADGDVEPDFSYRRGLRCAWAFPLDMVRSFKDKAIHLRLRPFLSDLINPVTFSNIRRDDLNPGFMQLVVAINHFYDIAWQKVRKTKKRAIVAKTK
jgi:predicted ATP-grasp superfamily ATP-dependent carboligase